MLLELSQKPATRQNKRSSNQQIYIYIYIPTFPLTSKPLHPGTFVNTQVVIDDLEDVAQQCVHVLRGKWGAACIGTLRVALWPVLPPVRHVATQHGQHHLHHVWHLCVAHAWFSQFHDLFQSFLQGWDQGTHLFHLSWETACWEINRERDINKNGITCCPLWNMPSDVGWWWAECLYSPVLSLEPLVL